MEPKKERKTATIDGRLYVQGDDGLYAAVPRGMDDARDLKARPAAKYAANPENGSMHRVVDDVRQYVHGLEQGGAPILRMAGDGGDGPRLTANKQEAVCFFTGSDREALSFVGLMDTFDTTDPEHIRKADYSMDDAGRRDSVQAVYQLSAIPGPDGRLPGMDLRYLNYKPGDVYTSGGASRTVSEGMSVPVQVLFNENSSSGETMSLCSASVKCEGGAVHDVKAGDDFIVGHEDLSETAAFGTPVDAWIEDEQDREKDYAIAYAPRKLSSLDRMRDMARETDAREAERSAGREAGNDGLDA